MRKSQLRKLKGILSKKQKIKRYCKGCGKVVDFYKSDFCRTNANGKKLFSFTIYKCLRGHTWNKKD